MNYSKDYILLQLLICLNILTIIAIYIYIDSQTAVRAAYTTIGLFTAYIIYRYSHTTHAIRLSESLVSLERTSLLKLFFILALSIYSISIFTDSRHFILVIMIPVGYTIIAAQFLYYRTEPATLVLEVVLLSLLESTSKYLLTGIHVGNTDTLKHLLKVQEINKSGTSSVLTTVYQYIPGLHNITTILHKIVSIPIYDTAILTVISSYAIVLLGIGGYLLGRSPRFAVLSVLSLSVLYEFLLNRLYFFPQGFATVVAVFFIFTILLFNESPRHRIIANIFGLSMIITHHITSFIAFFSLFMLAALSYVDQRIDFNGDIKSINLSKPNISATIALFSLMIAYYSLFAEEFMALTTRIGGGIISGGLEFALTTDGGSSDRLWTFGLQIADGGLINVVLSLISVNGLYQSLIFTLVTISIIELTAPYRKEEHEHSRITQELLPIITFGVLGFVYIIKTPLDIKLLPRIRLFFGFFSSLAISAGMSSLVINRPEMKRSVFILLILTGATAHIVAADDIQMDYGNQRTIPEDEVVRLEHVSSFLGVFQPNSNSHEDDYTITSFRNRKDVLRYNGLTPRGIPVSEGYLSYDKGVFLYSKNWENSRVVTRYPRPYQTYVILSPEKTYTMAQRQNKVYDSKPIGLLWTSNEQEIIFEPTRRY